MAAKERAIRRPKPFGRRRSILSLSLVPAFALVLASDPVAAQQPSQRPAPWSGSVAPPAPILGLADARPHAPLEFSRAWLAKVESVRQRRDELAAAGRLDGMSPVELAAEGAALSGRLRVPVIPVRYADVAVPFAEADLERRLFGPARGDTVSFTSYWAEASGGLLAVEGEVAPWIEARRRARHYLPPEEFGWSSFGRVVELRDEALAAADLTIDFSKFDNDGPDGVPDSGDDDGFVDFVALVYALPCPSDGRAGAIWPHRAAMPPFETRSIGFDGTPIRISDYVVLPAVDPVTCGPLHVGVLAHETGHALGLPDLYDYDGSSQGIGGWGLMGTGSHAAPFSPAHPGAWEKEQLGWVTVSWLGAADSAVAFEPVQRGRTVYRFDGDGGDYLLLENRDRAGSDRSLPGGGLLVWHIDPERAELGAWNGDERRPAVSILQADGRSDLARGRPADSGDPFPGRYRRASFHSYLAGGLNLSRIRADADAVHARILTGASRQVLSPDVDVLRMTALAGSGPVRQTVRVRQSGEAEVHWRPDADASWLDPERVGDMLVLTADPRGLAAGTYAETVTIRDEEGSEPANVVVSFYVASPGVAQVISTELPWSWGVAVHDGRILQASYGWDNLGLRPRPRVLQLRDSETHPRTLARLAADALYSPIIDPRDGASFVLARAADGNYLYRTRADGDAHVVAARIGDKPAYGAAVLPGGDIAVAQWDGVVSRVRRDGTVLPWLDLGVNVYQIASDAGGAIYAATLEGDVLRVAPDGARTVLQTGFGRGRLVTVATTPDGAVLAAERGGRGRILLIAADGARDVVYHRPGALFYGLAVDDGFLFALDLSQRQLLRIPLPR